MRRALPLLLLPLLPFALGAANGQAPIQLNANSSASTQYDCVWKGETFSVGAAFCWQPGRKLSCSTPTKDHKEAWWEDQPEPVCGSADVP
jgi:hypothetical protein